MIARWINRRWRLLMTAFCFALFGLGGLMLSIVWFNLLLLVIRDKKYRRSLARRSITFSFRVFLSIAKFTGALDYRIDGAATLREETGCLVVANHPTLIDYVLLASVMPETDCIVKSALLSNPFLSGVVKAADYLINSQSETLLAHCQQRLDAGDTVLIFPEGTRTIPGESPVLQRGAANIAVRCGCDLRVVHIQCSQNLLAKQSKWYHIPPEKPFFHVIAKDKINITDFYNDAQIPSVAARQLNQHLLQHLTPDHFSLSGTCDASALS